MKGITLGALNVKSSKVMHHPSGIKRMACNRKNSLRNNRKSGLRKSLESNVIISTYMT